MQLNGPAKTLGEKNGQTWDCRVIKQTTNIECLRIETDKRKISEALEQADWEYLRAKPAL